MPVESAYLASVREMVQSSVRLVFHGVPHKCYWESFGHIGQHSCSIKALLAGE